MTEGEMFEIARSRIECCLNEAANPDDWDANCRYARAAAEFGLIVAGVDEHTACSARPAAVTIEQIASISA